LLDSIESHAKRNLHDVLKTDYLQEAQEDLPKAPPCLGRESTKPTQIRSIRRWYTERLMSRDPLESLEPKELKFFMEIQKWESALTILDMGRLTRTLLELDDPPTEALSMVMFNMGFEAGMMFGYGGATQTNTMQAWRSLLGSIDVKGKRWQKARHSEQEIAEPAIEWIFKKWTKGDASDHAEASERAHNRFNLEKEGISLHKFRGLVKEAAYKHFPHKVRGTKRPPAL
jgi:hypothetical protein